MSDTSRHTDSGSPRTSSRELHVLADRPVEVLFQFEQRQSRVGIGSSIGAHIVLVLIAIAVMRYQPPQQAYEPPPPSLDRVIWLAEPGPGGGGGGGGNRAPDPPRPAEVPGREKITVPVQPPAPTKPAPPKPEEPQPEQDLTIPVKALASAEQMLPGVIESANVSAETTDSQGSGNGGGAGTGTGNGIGPGQGSGLGPGFGGNTGGGAYRPGSGISVPKVIQEVKPHYTAEAMRAKVQGVAWIECVVMPDGTVGDVRIIRSLDPVFGLDQEAVKAARQWRFIPGTRQGEPVPVIVTIELTFTLR